MTKFNVAVLTLLALGAIIFASAKRSTWDVRLGCIRNDPANPAGACAMGCQASNTFEAQSFTEDATGKWHVKNTYTCSARDPDDK
jgi:hypothetical protein